MRNDAMRNDVKFEEELTFQNWHEEFDEFWHEHLKVSKKFHFNVLLLSKVYIVWAKKSTEELSFMKSNKDTKFEEDSNFDLSTQKSQRFSL